MSTGVTLEQMLKMLHMVHAGKAGIVFNNSNQSFHRSGNVSTSGARPILEENGSDY